MDKAESKQIQKIKDTLTLLSEMKTTIDVTQMNKEGNQVNKSMDNQNSSLVTIPPPSKEEEQT